MAPTLGHGRGGAAAGSAEAQEHGRRAERNAPRLETHDRYGYRVDGPWDPAEGLRFNVAQLLLDPYGHAVSGDIDPQPALFGYRFDDHAKRNHEDSAPYTARSVVVDPSFDWEGEKPMKRRWRDSVLYELHVKGFTALHDRVPEHLRGTYAGLAEPAVTDEASPVFTPWVPAATRSAGRRVGWTSTARAATAVSARTRSGMNRDRSFTGPSRG